MKTLAIFLFMVGLAVTATLAQANEVEIQAGDQITVDLRGVPEEFRKEASGLYTVSDAGTIPLPYIPDPKAAGLKPSQLGRAIEETKRIFRRK